MVEWGVREFHQRGVTPGFSLSSCGHSGGTRLGIKSALSAGAMVFRVVVLTGIVPTARGSGTLFKRCLLGRGAGRHLGEFCL